MISETSPKAWLSVITSDGLTASPARAFSSSVSLVTTGTAPASRISLITCCCGKISLPFGAAESIGTTNTTKSRGLIKSPTSFNFISSVFKRIPIFSLSSCIFSPVLALTYISFSASAFFCGQTSDLLNAIIYGIFFCTKIFSSSFSVSEIPVKASTTSTAISVLLRICLVFFIRISPSSPLSSKPAVSIITTGPSGKSSIDFKTGSVVVPFTSETMAIC